VLEIRRIEQPTIEEYRDAAQVWEAHWEYLKPLNRRERFEVFQKLGVELIVARDEEGIQGVCLVLPDTFTVAQQERKLVWLFELAASKKLPGVGGLILYRIMSWYPAIASIGVSDEAKPVYDALRWKRHDRVWRCVHPVSLTQSLTQYRSKLGSAWKFHLIRAAGCLYDPIMAVWGAIWGLGVRVCDLPVGQSHLARVQLASSYLKVYRASIKGKTLEVVERGGAGRIVLDQMDGLNRMRGHAAMWRTLRGRNVPCSEFLALTRQAARQAMFLGYIPLRMPIYYWEKKSELGSWLESLERTEFTFASCDKVL
jgi:hypothetical protein